MRWRQLRAPAPKLKSLIWLYWTRTALFEDPGTQEESNREHLKEACRAQAVAVTEFNIWWKDHISQAGLESLRFELASEQYLLDDKRC